MSTKSLDGVLIKKANQQETYTEQQVEDLVKCMDPDEGYLHFAKNFAYIQHPVKGKLLFDPYEYQVRLMYSYHNHRFNINMMPRQTGKTTCAAIYLTWYAMFHPDQTILIAAHKYTGAQEIMQRIRYVYEMCPDFIRAGVTSYNKGSIEFENGSRIVSQTTTGNTGRGMSISLLYCLDGDTTKVKVRKVCESLTPYYYYYKYEGIPAMEKPLVSIDIGGGTSDVAIYKEEAPILFSSYRFAGDAIFGDNFNRNININGFVDKYYDEIIELLNENGQPVLIEALNKIRESDASHDVINVFFSLRDNKALNDNGVDIDFLNLLKKDNEFKVIFLLFYLSQIYHIAQLMCAKEIDIPGVISFSGTASKLLTILDSSNKHDQLRSLALEVFKYVFKINNSLDIEIKLPDNPKEISSKGGISVPDSQDIELDDIKETLIVNSTTQSSNQSKISYQQVYEYENKALNDFDDFLNFFLNLNKKYSYRDNFGIDKSYLDFTKEFLNKRKVNALKTGIKDKLSEISDESDEEINETIFFYPLVGTLGELAYKIQSDKES